MNFLCFYLVEGKGGGGTDASICGIHSQPLEQNCLMNVYETL